MRKLMVKALVLATVASGLAVAPAAAHGTCSASGITWKSGGGGGSVYANGHGECTYAHNKLYIQACLQYQTQFGDWATKPSTCSAKTLYNVSLINRQSFGWECGIIDNYYAWRVKVHFKVNDGAHTDITVYRGQDNYTCNP
jgi:hypothetical protein